MNFAEIIGLLTGKTSGSVTEDKETHLAQLDSYKNGLAEYFAANILPQQTKLETIRQEKLVKLKNTVFIAALVSVITIALSAAGILFILSNNVDSDLIKLPILITITVVGGIFYWAFAPAREYCAIIKDEVYSKIVNFLGPKFLFNQSTSIAHKLQQSDIIPRYDNWTSDDIICGEHEGVKIEIEECKLTYERRNGKNSTTVTTFRGIMVLLSMNKNFNGKTIVKADGGGIGNWFSEKFGDNETVHLEDPEFEKMFQVFATDQVEARYLLTTAFMERVLKLRESFSNNGLEGEKGEFQFSFFANQLLITIPLGKNMFEPKPITEPALQISDVTNFLDEIYLIFEIIDQLKLNMRIGL